MIKIEGLGIEGHFTGPVLRLRLEGHADPRDGAQLAENFLGWHREVLKQKATEVRVDVAAVEFMNSTALGAFVTWVAELQKLPAAARYRIAFEGNSKRRWQRSSLHALASFAPEHLSVSFPEGQATAAAPTTPR